ncbi:hypothetical protein VNO77_01666 [Canavalia gladiata]|uniref:Uncharacterized protein n=1 Tax=Canavalia gladiata TaxID=3824 RepID=A0AAN9RAH1_CANGL
MDLSLLLPLILEKGNERGVTKGLGSDEVEVLVDRGFQTKVVRLGGDDDMVAVLSPPHKWVQNIKWLGLGKDECERLLLYPHSSIEIRRQLNFAAPPSPPSIILK